MTGTMEAAGGIAGLLFGGFLFIVVGKAVTETMETEPLINFQLMGALYIVGAIILAIGVVYTVIYSLLK